MKTVLITGATDGIGRKTAELLALKQHHIIIHGRDASKVQKVRKELVQSTGSAQIEGIVGDFIDFESIKMMIVEMKNKQLRPDIIINNAAIFEPDHIILSNGIEKTFMVNYLAPYYLTRLLLSTMLSQISPRVVNVSSMAQTGTVDFNNLMGFKKYDCYEAYALSKLCNVLFTYYLHRNYQSKGLVALSLHPGVINTKLLQVGWGSGGDDPLYGAQRVEFAAMADEEGISGKYFVNNQPAKSAAISYDVRIQERLWNMSSQLCGLAKNE